MSKKTICVSAIVSLALLFAACDMADSESERSTGKVSVRVQILQARTASPIVALSDANAWELWGGKSGAVETRLAEFSSAAGATVSLDPGTWNFTLKGFEDGDLILSGTITGQAVSAAGTNTLAFTVEPAMEGEGSVNIVIELPAGSGITTARVFRDDSLISSATPSDNRIAIETAHTAGDYYFSVRLYKGDNLYGVVSEVVQVRANRESAKTYTLTWEDLKYTIEESMTLAEFLTWLETNAEEGGNYSIILRADETIAPKALYYYDGGYKHVSIRISGDSTERTVSLSSNGSLFYVGSGVTLTLGENVTLQGRSGNTASLVRVYEGTLVMESGAKITGNTTTSGGGGVGVSDGTFTMNGGTISDNTASGSSSSSSGGGGVSMSGGTFTMNGGEISGNTASSNGGGVYVGYNGTFTVSGGEISGNTASGSSYASGGGVYVSEGTFTQSGGTISGNTASSNGGGVYVYSNGTFTMSGGAISGNTASSGGGVYVYSNGTFTMSGGAISGNTASSGGGVYVGSSGTFTKQSGGIIYGFEANDTLKNTATGGYTYGHAVYVFVNLSSSKKRNTTAGEGVTLDSAQDGAAGGWVDSMPSNLSLAESLTWLASNAEDGGAYTITLRANETIAPKPLSYSYDGGYKQVSITINGDSTERTISLSSSGSLFYVQNNVTLTLGNNVTLQGRTDNTSSLVQVYEGTLVMESGSKITGNTASSSGGGGVSMSGGTFTMNGGEISGNTASSSGGGVYVYDGTFTMSGGEISGNTVSSSSFSSGGGGVYVGSSATFEMTGGTISGNTASSSGGGVYVSSSGTFTQSGGAISGNTASGSSYASGGGVYVDSSGTFTQSGGAISGNTASGSSYASGGGVYVYSSGTFTKESGGVIYGKYNSSGASEDSALQNTASNDTRGHAVYVNNGGKKRNSTAGTGVTLDSTQDGAAGGWVEPTPLMPSNLSLAEALTWLDSYAEEGGNYTITLRANETIAPKSLSYSGKNVSITLNGDTTERTVSLDSTGNLFYVGRNVTLTLGNNVTLQGRTDNTSSLVQVDSGGTLVMESGAKLTGNTGGGVYVNYGTFEMSGGEISGNTAGYGGGVLVGGGTFTQSGGEISGNTASGSGSSSGGGGVYVSYGTFEMSGGEISGNTASSNGGGVYVYSGTFTKGSGGVIYGKYDSSGALEDSALQNTASNGDTYGHAVYVSSNKLRDSTVGTGVTLDSAVNGAAGGWFMPTFLSLQAALTWLDLYAEEGGDYTITLRANETIAPTELSYRGKQVSITINGDSTERTVSLISDGTLFTVESGVTLTLGNNVTLQGRSGNSGSLARVNSGGTLVMESGSKITGNTGYGGVSVSGTFTMNGGEVSGNTASSSNGGGVYVSNGTFTMNGGEISGNTASGSGSSSGGGGVYVSNGTFTMNGGEISGNTAAAASSSYGYGGGVYVSSSGTFTKGSGGVIYGRYNSNGALEDSALQNTASNGDTYGHAVYVSSSKKRNSTAGTGVIMNSSLDGAAGGWVGTMPITSLQAALTWLDSSAEEGGNYIITLRADESIAPKKLSYSGKQVSITIIGDSTERMVSLDSTGTLFSVRDGVTLTLGNNVTLQGLSGNTSSLVDSEGTLVMESGAKITGNTSSSGGGGVYVWGGTFTMNGGEISGNTSSSSSGGGGVFVWDGTFTMCGGEISGNIASSSASYYVYGGGVSVNSGTFTMSGGEISGNTASSTSSYAYGGGVYNRGTFTMSGGEISGNTAFSSSYAYGGGVSGTVTKQSGGTIYGSDAAAALQNTATNGDTSGHAVYVSSSKKRNTTAGVGVTLDSSVSGAAGGWED